jgi:hypothetical protein
VAMKTKKAKKPSTSSNGVLPTAGEKKGNQETVSGYFRTFFKQNPKALNERSNDAVLKQWQEDHPGQKVSTSVKSGLSNIKSVLRSKKRRKSKKAAAEQPSYHTDAAFVATVKPIKMSALETLEETIDNCLNLARATETETLEIVVHHLRKARNAVVWQMGEPG